jgi:hypothetical protein
MNWRSTFKESGYSQRQIQCAITPPVRIPQPIEKPTLFASLPYVQMAYSHISRRPAENDIMCVGLPPGKIAIFLYLVKDDLGLKTTGVCSILYDCGQVYIGQTGQSIEPKVKEQYWHI